MSLFASLLLAAAVAAGTDQPLASGTFGAEKTAFAIAADEKAVTLAVKTSGEAVDFYLIPDGNAFEYYVFTVGTNGLKDARFYSESGNIEPDPYMPVWEATARSEGDKLTVRATIPLTALYMTRSAAWKTDWKVNVASRKGTDVSVWAGDLKPERSRKFLETFKTVKGFPLRAYRDDVFIKAAVATVDGMKAGRPAGELKLTVYCNADSKFTLKTPWSEPTEVHVPFGGGTVSVPAVYPGAGRFPIRLRLVRSDGRKFEREFPVHVGYEPIRLKLAKPQYRSNFYPGQNSDAVEGTVSAMTGEACELTLEGPGFAKQTLRPGPGGKFRFDTRGFAEGDALLTITSGKDTLVRKIRKLKPLGPGRHMTWIEDGNLILDGKPVVRRSIYADGFMGGTAFAKRYKADNFHQTTNIRQIGSLDIALLSKDIRATEGRRDQRPSQRVYDWLDKTLTRGLNESNGAYYYIIDEPECHGTSAVYLKYIYDYAAEKDPYHVILSCCRSGDRYIDIADWFETHPYLNAHEGIGGKRVYGRGPEVMGSYVDAYHPKDHPEKCIGGVPTCFAYTRGDYPTFDEYMLNYWVEIVRGAKTMFPYAYHDLGDRPALYEGTRYMFESLEALEYVLTRGKITTLVKTPTHECGLWTMPGGERMFVLVNFTQEPQTVTVPDLRGSYREFRGTRTFRFWPGLSKLRPPTFRLKPLESIVACEKDYDRGLKPLAEVRRTIEAQEYERTHRDNQLLGRHNDMDVVTSFGRRGAWRDDAVKVFDGVRDVIAWRDEWSKDKFFEMAFTKFIPTFSEVHVYGHNIDGYTVRVRRDGAWVDLKPASVEKDGWRITLKFEKPVTTVKMRLGFPKNHVEVYEVELPGKAREIAFSTQKPAHKGVHWTMRPDVVTNSINWTVKHPAEPSFLVFTMGECPPIKDNAYLNWQLHDFNGKGTLCADVGLVLEGLYTLRYPAAPKPSNGILRVYDWNFRLDFGEIVCCREPANYAELTQRDGAYHVRVKLDAPCEDMTCSFYLDSGNRPRPFVVGNGRNSLDLKPVDAARTVWEGSVPLPPIKDPNKPPFPLISVNALGGTLATPIYTWLAK